MKLSAPPALQPVPERAAPPCDFDALLEKTPAAVRPQEAQARIRAVLDELDDLVGLYEVKRLFFEVQAYAEVQRLRRALELAAETTVLHAVFSGNPGTGKTTVARIAARLYKELGLLEKGQLVEVERADLVGEFVGHTAQRTREQLKKAAGGVLFIDEAYSLIRGGENDFGKEAIDTLVKAMEDEKHHFVLILAGYPLEMQRFLDSNPGLRSRFPLHVFFPDYKLSELAEIARREYARRQYLLSEEGEAELLRLLAQSAPGENGNARLLRNLLEASLRAQAVRLMQGEGRPGREALQQIFAADIAMAAARLGLPDAAAHLFA